MSRALDHGPEAVARQRDVPGASGVRLAQRARAPCRTGRTTSTGMPWRHPFGTRSLPSPKRIRRHAAKNPTRHGFGDRHGIPRKHSARRIEPAGHEGSLARQTAATQVTHRRRSCQPRSAVSCPANRASRDRFRGPPRFRSRRTGIACRREKRRGLVRGLTRAEPGDGDRLSARGWHPEQRARLDRREQDHPVRPPRPARTGLSPCQCLHQPAIEIDSLQLPEARRIRPSVRPGTRREGSLPRCR